MRHFSYMIILVALLVLPASRAQTPVTSPPEAEYDPANWKEFASTEGGFTVSMPGVPTAYSVPINTPAVQIVMHNYILKTKLGEYGVSYFDFPVHSEEPAIVKGILDGARDEVLANAAKLLNENDVTLDGMVGREFIVAQGGAIGRNQLFFVKGRLYALTLATTPNVAFSNGQPSPNPADHAALYETTSGRFFRSFKLSKTNAAQRAALLRARKSSLHDWGLLARASQGFAVR
jgi:hypothetical protein